jgi:hypothetical protein
MPFVSQKQRAWMYSQKPEMAKEWESATPKGKKLPKYAKGSKAAGIHQGLKGGSHGGGSAY